VTLEGQLSANVYAEYEERLKALANRKGDVDKSTALHGFELQREELAFKSLMKRHVK
jgi:hypothetical protein